MCSVHRESRHQEEKHGMNWELEHDSVNGIGTGECAGSTKVQWKNISIPSPSW